VSTQSNPTFQNPIGIGQVAPPATSTTSTTGNQVGAGAGVATPSSVGVTGSQGASISTTSTANGTSVTSGNVSSTVGTVGTSSNGLPIGTPGSGKGSPENPF